MLLEVLSDFQISIPELGRVQARTHPIVLLTSNNSRELTEALKRRCLYLWLDYPDARARARNRAPARARAVRDGRAPAGRGDRHGARARPEEAAVDRRVDRLGARAAAARRPTTSTRDTFTETMSVIVKHRTDMDVVAERVGLKLGIARRCRLSPRACRRAYSSSARSCAAKASRSAPRSCSTRSRCCARSAGPRRRTSARRSPRRSPRARRTAACSSWCSTASSSAPSRSRRSREGVREETSHPRRGSTSTSSPTRSSRRCARRSPPRCATARRGRCATSRGWRSPRSARRQEGSGVIGVDVQRIRRALGLRAEPQPELPAEDPRRDGLPRDALRRFEALLRRELERAQIERTGSLPPARPLGELDRALPSGPLADLAAVHRVVAQLRRRLATQGMQARGHRRHAHVDVRRTMRASLQTGGVPVVLKYRPRRPATPGDLRALRRLHERHLGVGVLPVGAARAARHVSQDALVRVHRARSPRSPTSSSTSATSKRSANGSPATRAWPTSPATPTTAACGRSSSCRSRTTCTRARR